jgi:hypothetical protein
MAVMVANYGLYSKTSIYGKNESMYNNISLFQKGICCCCYYYYYNYGDNTM